MNGSAAAVREGLSLFALCWTLAKVEIEIEGGQGWAASLPTWRWEPEWWLNLTNGKALTGYHLWLTLFLVGVFHLPLVFAGFSRELWAKCASSYLLVTAAWDLQWFAWNPAWGLAKFRSTPVPWFRRKLLGFPVDYYAALAASGAATWLIWSPGLHDWCVRAAVVLAASAASAAIAGLAVRPKTAPLAGLLLALVLTPSLGAAQSEKSDLGEQGNLFVAKTFDAYRRLHPEGACRAAGPGKRVLVTGYGLFSGVPYNVSGTVVRSMADPAFWPERVDLKSPALSVLAAPRAGLLAPSDPGGAAFNRSLFIDGERYEACFLVLDVIWDLAGAIVVHEESRFKPGLVIMTGRGGAEASFEGGALNRASPFPGYDADGHPLGSLNVPESPWVVADEPADAELPMNWDSRALAASAGAGAAALGYSAVGRRAARPENNYLCNDVSFVALHASLNRPTSLAGGRVLLGSPELAQKPVVGFLHFPAVDTAHPDLAAYGAGISGWIRVLAGTIARSSR